MTPHGWITLITIFIVIIALVNKKRIGPDLIMAGGLVVLMICGVVSFHDAVAGFAERPMLMIAGLFVVAAGLQETGGVELIGRKLLGRPTSLTTAQARMMVPVAAMSAFMNTTPIVAMYLPMVSDWAKRLKIPVSKMLMPLSFGAILGGQGTMIGTGSNLIIMGLFIEWWHHPPAWVTELGVSAPSGTVSMWGAAWIGIPVAIFGMLFILLTSKWLLPDRTPPHHEDAFKREYEIKMRVNAGSPIIGQNIADAGLRNLPDLYLHAMVRDDQLITGLSPQMTLQNDDKLIFVGDVDAVIDIRKIRGLVPATDELEYMMGDRFNRRLVEVVVSETSPLISQTIKESQFRTRYNAVVLAVHRKGHHIEGKIGQIKLNAGDTLLVESNDDFLRDYRQSGDFYLVSEIENSRPLVHERAFMSLCILALMIFLLTTNLIGRVAAIWLCGLLMIATRCINGPTARRAINIQILIVIGAAMGIGKAVEQSGLAELASGHLLNLAHSMNVGNYGTLFLVFAMTSIAAQLMTNFGAAVIMFPIVIGAAHGLDVSPYPFVFTMMTAAGCNFITPITYQTNLMVYGPGGYHFTDFQRLGIPLTLLVALIAVIVAPIVFPFTP